MRRIYAGPNAPSRFWTPLWIELKASTNYPAPYIINSLRADYQSSGNLARLFLTGGPAIEANMRMIADAVTLVASEPFVDARGAPWVLGLIRAASGTGTLMTFVVYHATR